MTSSQVRRGGRSQQGREGPRYKKSRARSAFAQPFPVHTSMERRFLTAMDMLRPWPATVNGSHKQEGPGFTVPSPSR